MAQLYKASVKYWLDSDSFYSEFTSSTELGEQSWVLQLSKYLVIHTFSWILYLEDSLESIPLEKLQVFLFFLEINSFFHLLLLPFFFPRNKKHEHSHFHLFPVCKQRHFPQNIYKVKFEGANLQKVIGNYIKPPWNLQISLLYEFPFLPSQRGLRPLHFSCSTESLYHVFTGTVMHVLSILQKPLMTNHKPYTKLKECYVSDHLAAVTIHLFCIITSMNHKLKFKLGD